MGFKTAATVRRQHTDVNPNHVVLKIGKRSHVDNCRRRIRKVAVDHKFRLLGSLAVQNTDALIARLDLADRSADEIRTLYDFEIARRAPIDAQPQMAGAAHGPET